MEILAFVGIAVLIIGGLGVLIAAFKTSVLWGLGCLMVPPVSLIYLILHWPDAKNPFLLQLVGLGILFVSFLGDRMVAY